MNNQILGHIDLNMKLTPINGLNYPTELPTHLMQKGIQELNNDINDLILYEINMLVNSKDRDF